MTDGRSGDPIAEAQARVAQAMRGLADAGPRIESIGDTAQGVEQQVRVQAAAAATAGAQAAEQVRDAASQVRYGQQVSGAAQQPQHSQPVPPQPAQHAQSPRSGQPAPQGPPAPATQAAQDAAQKAQKAVSQEVRDVKRAGQRVQNRADAAVDRSARSPLTGIVGGMVLLAALGVFLLLMGMLLQTGFGSSDASAGQTVGLSASEPASAATSSTGAAGGPFLDVVVAVG